jgi:hypothetical protein
VTAASDRDRRPNFNPDNRGGGGGGAGRRFGGGDRRPTGGADRPRRDDSAGRPERRFDGSADRRGGADDRRADSGDRRGSGPDRDRRDDRADRDRTHERSDRGERPDRRDDRPDRPEQGGDRRAERTEVRAERPDRPDRRDDRGDRRTGSSTGGASRDRYPASGDRRPAARRPGQRDSGGGSRFDRDHEPAPPRTPAPVLPEGLADVKLAGEVRRDLLGLRKEVADEVSQHLVAAGSLLEDDPERALAHARYARGKASRLAVVREAVGLAAYHAGEWTEAIAELRAARRMGGGPGHLAVMADAERALGRPERALELARGPEAAELDRAEAIELLIVAAGARRDLGEADAAVISLQVADLKEARRDPWSPRLFYAYADALLAAGRRDEAVQWFLHAAEADDEELTDASERLAELSEEAPDPAPSGGSGS